MAGLREMKKKNTRKAILEYAGKRFSEDSYDFVKTSEIAKSVGIGEGTLFNYFDSKGQLFIESVFDDFEAIKYERMVDEITSEDILVTELLNLVDCYLSKMFLVSKDLLLEFLSVIYSRNNGGMSITDKKMLYFDEQMLLQLNELIESVDKGNEADVDVISVCILSCLISQFTVFVYDNEMTYDDVMHALRQQIAVIIRGNITFA